MRRWLIPEEGGKGKLTEEMGCWGLGEQIAQSPRSGGGGQEMRAKLKGHLQ